MEDNEIVEAMVRYGGGFVQGLGRLYRQADDDNRRRLKVVFPEYWLRYAEIAHLHETREGNYGTP